MPHVSTLLLRREQVPRDIGVYMPLKPINCIVKLYKYFHAVINRNVIFWTVSHKQNISGDTTELKMFIWSPQYLDSSLWFLAHSTLQEPRDIFCSWTVSGQLQHVPQADLWLLALSLLAWQTERMHRECLLWIWGIKMVVKRVGNHKMNTSAKLNWGGGRHLL